MSASPDGPRAAAALSDDIERLRIQHQVRLVESEEEGTALDRLPAGVYGFAYAPGQTAIPLFAKKTYHSFEIHKTADGSAYLLGFVSSEEAAAIESAKEGAAIRLFPDPWENSQRLVSVPLARVVSPAKTLPREDGNPFPFTLG